MRLLPEQVLRIPTLIDMKDAGSASGFMAKNKGTVFFVTAKHVIFNRDNLVSKMADLFVYSNVAGFAERGVLRLNLEMLNDRGCIKQHSRDDIVVVKIGRGIPIGAGIADISFDIESGVIPTENPSNGAIILADTETDFKKYDEIAISEEIFIFGYPASIGMKDFPQIDYTKPLLRRGTVAGKNENLKTIILDCPVYFGNSGGPVLVVEELKGKRKHYIIGIVSQFIPFEENWFSLQYRITNKNIENSGYSVAAPIDSMLELFGAF